MEISVDVSVALRDVVQEEIKIEKPEVLGE